MKKTRQIESELKGYISLTEYGYSTYKINLKKGLIISGNKIIGSPDGNNGHIKVLMMNDEGVRTNQQIYKLVWKVAHDEKDIPIGYKLIHINEDKTDNRLVNLQLIKIKGHTTRYDNITKYVCLKNINTHEVIKFKSIDDCLDYTGLYKKHFYKSAILQEPIKAKNDNIYNLFIETINE